jgi:hypothetical protein
MIELQAIMKNEFLLQGIFITGGDLGVIPGVFPGGNSILLVGGLGR